jgi:hypothetical protein
MDGHHRRVLRQRQLLLEMGLGVAVRRRRLSQRLGDKPRDHISHRKVIALADGLRLLPQVNGEVDRGLLARTFGLAPARVFLRCWRLHATVAQP